MYCEYCGNQIRNQANFCVVCGQKVLKLEHQESLVDISDNMQSLVNQPYQKINDVYPQQSGNQAGAAPIYSNTNYSTQSPMPPIIMGKSMKWFNLLIKYFIVLWLFFGTFIYISQTSEIIHETLDGDFFAYLYNPITRGLGAFDVVAQISSVIILFLAWSRLRRYQLSGYRLILLFFIFTLIRPAISFLFVAEFQGLDEIISSMLAMAIIALPNIIYFYKRRGIFCN